MIADSAESNSITVYIGNVLFDSPAGSATVAS